MRAIDKERRFGLHGDLPPDQSSKDWLTIYKNAGFNILSMTEDFVKAESQAYLDCLKLCEQIDLDVYVRQYSDQAPYYYEKHFPFVDFKDYPAVKGFYVDEEMDKFMLDDIAEVNVPWFNDKYEGYDWYMNTFVGEHPNFFGPAVEYWDKAIKVIYNKLKTNHKMFTVDIYPLRKSLEKGCYLDKQRMIHGLSLPARICHDNGVKFGAYMQTFTGYCDCRKVNSMGELRFLAYLYLAFGVQHLGYFVYRSSNLWGFDGIVTEDGRPTALYPLVRKLNKEILSFDREYLSYDWKGTLILDGTKTPELDPTFSLAREYMKYPKDDGIENISAEYDMMVGCFDKDGKKAYVFANYDEPTVEQTNKVSVKFNKITKVEVIKNGQRSIVDLKDGEFILEVNNGDGYFVKEI